MSILVVDDVSLMRKILSDILTGFCGIGKADILEAADANTAIREAKRHKPGLVFLDMLMPGKTGQEAITEMLANDPNIYIVMVSSANERRTVEACIAAGAKDYMVKPLDADRVKLALANSGYKSGG